MHGIFFFSLYAAKRIDHKLSAITVIQFQLLYFECYNRLNMGTYGMYSGIAYFCFIETVLY